MLVTVKTAEGRVAYDAPRGGERIPSDRFVTVERTPWISRRIEVGDLEVEPAKAKAKVKNDAVNPAPAA